MARISRSFYTRDDVLQISRDLLGKYLVTNFNGKTTAGIIIETEAYRAPEDQASHARNNLRTARTETMFKVGGTAYVYLCYGIHHLFNVVTAEQEVPHAVLIRAIKPAEGQEIMLKRRGFPKLRPQLTSGPGVMSKALGITTTNDGIDLTSPKSPIWIEDRGTKYTAAEILQGPRIGIDYAGECAAWPWRFWVE